MVHHAERRRPETVERPVRPHTPGGAPHRRRRRAAVISVTPTLFTLGNLVAGFAAIHYAAKPIDYATPWGWSSLTFAGVLVFLGLFLDSIDGTVARWTRSESDLGAQLDSLCDLVTFGVAPAFMMLRLVSSYGALNDGVHILGPEQEHALARLVWGVAAVFVCCTALRLARFNIEGRSSDVEDHMTFRGLPSPGAAGAVVSLIMLHQHWLATVSDTLAQWAAWVLPGVTLLCAVAMVSSIPFVHFTNRYLAGPRSFSYVARVAVMLGLAIWWLQEVMAFIFTTYALSGPAQLILTKMKGRRLARQAN